MRSLIVWACNTIAGLCGRLSQRVAPQETQPAAIWVYSSPFVPSDGVTGTTDYTVTWQSNN